MIDYLRPAAPFNFPQMLQRPLSRLSKLTVIDLQQRSYTRALRLRARITPVTVSADSPVDDPVLRLEYSDGLSVQERAEVRDRITRMFSSDVNVHAFYKAMNPYPEWSSLIHRFYGLRPIQDADLFESMVKIIIGQQLNVKFAATLVERLIDFAAVFVDWGDTRLPAFPSAGQVAQWSYDDLRQLSFSQRKAEYVIDFARAVVAKRVDLEALQGMSDERIYEELTSLRGIGRWTVECFLLFGMGRPDVIPAADIGIQNALHRLYELDERPKAEAVRHLAERWTPWRSYATYYLWQSLIRPTEL